jgi:uncharacterized protein (DUF1778 family)
MGSTATKPKGLRAENINLRVSRNQKSLIDRAADALGRSRSDFMLDAACRAAESTLLDRVYFRLNDAEFKKFMDMLDNPPARNPGLDRLMSTKAPWDK